MAQTQIRFKKPLSNQIYFIAGMLWMDTKIYFFLSTTSACVSFGTSKFSIVAARCTCRSTARCSHG